MKRFQDSAKYLLLIAVIGIASCGYKGPLYLPEQPETNQPESQEESQQGETPATKEEG